MPGGLKRRFGNATVKRGAAGRVWRLGTAPGGRTVRGVTEEGLEAWRPEASLWLRDGEAGRRGGSGVLERRLETDGEVVTEEGLEAWTDACRNGTVKDAKSVGLATRSDAFLN